MYVNNTFRMEDIVRVRETLQEFERVKSKLQNKDINAYKKMSDLYNAIEPFQGQDIISGKQAVKQKISKFSIDSEEAKKYFENQEAKLFYRGSTIDVVIPLTKETSCFFGQNTQWCTARKDQENMFDNYSSESPLYIIFCKDGTRYQFFFGDDMQFMDKNDEEVDVVRLAEKIPELKKAFNRVATEKLFLPLIEKQTEEICLAAVQRDGYALYYVENKTPEICMAAVQRDGRALQFVKEQTPEICLAAVQQNGDVLQFVKKQTPEICMAAAKKDPTAVKYIKDPTMRDWVIANYKNY